MRPIQKIRADLFERLIFGAIPTRTEPNFERIRLKQCDNSISSGLGVVFRDTRPKREIITYESHPIKGSTPRGAIFVQATETLWMPYGHTEPDENEQTMLVEALCAQMNRAWISLLSRACPKSGRLLHRLTETALERELFGKIAWTSKLDRRATLLVNSARAQDLWGNLQNSAIEIKGISVIHSDFVPIDRAIILARAPKGTNRLWFLEMEHTGKAESPLQFAMNDGTCAAWINYALAVHPDDVRGINLVPEGE